VIKVSNEVITAEILPKEGAAVRAALKARKKC
jgi:hypothetical protein